MDATTNRNIDATLTLEGLVRSVVCLAGGVSGVLVCLSTYPPSWAPALACATVALVGLAGLVGGVVGVFTRN